MLGTMWEHRHNRNLKRKEWRCFKPMSCRMSRDCSTCWICKPVMDVSSSELRGRGKCSTSPHGCFLSFPLPRSSCVSVTEVCPAACLHVRRVLSLSINWSWYPTTNTNTHTSPCLQTPLHNSTRISGLREVYSPSCAATFFSLSPLSYVFFYPHTRTHTFSSLAVCLTCTFCHTYNTDCCVIHWVPDPSLISGFFYHIILTEGNIRRCWQSRLEERTQLPPVALVEKHVWIIAEQFLTFGCPISIHFDTFCTCNKQQ